ncbi:hypothetical protein GWI33_004346 [Rhynchophorus ferrugineus]|uniref:Uncharacterized protein n=1 Tax=Rhynchophorus ferrugineus TaxID=354439 RepID=A0A834J2T9_RHYFE|nr:hypothetical protein GWI33_004346 [Rhynchophorus ferrugineus]
MRVVFFGTPYKNYNAQVVYVLKHVCAKYFAYKKYKEEKDYEAQYHKNPDLFSARISAQQCFAEKLQEKYNQQIKEHEAKLQKKKEMMLLSNNVEHSGGYVLGRDDKKTKSLRSDYNPLMGYGSSSNYRPPKRSKCGGGGCGK